MLTNTAWYMVDYFRGELIYIGFFLLFSGWFGLFRQLKERNLIFVFLYFELITLGLSILALTFSLLHCDVYGMYLALILLVLAGAETSIGLAFIIVLIAYNVKQSNLSDSLNKLQG